MMKKMVCAMTMVLGLVAGICAMDNASAEMGKMQTIRAASRTIENGELQASNCFFYCYYYTPVVYCPCYYYSYSFVWFYNGASDTESNGLSGLRMENAPKPGSVLAKLGVKAGDIIMKIDGRAVKKAEDMNGITEKSNLTILRERKSASDGSALADLKF